MDSEIRASGFKSRLYPIYLGDLGQITYTSCANLQSIQPLDKRVNEDFINGKTSIAGINFSCKT